LLAGHVNGFIVGLVWYHLISSSVERHLVSFGSKDFCTLYGFILLSVGILVATGMLDLFLLFCL